MLTDFFQKPESDIDLPATVPEIYLGTVSGSDNSGIELTMDGETDPMTKKYRQILTGRPIPAGSRVAVMKTSGTYVVLGQIENAPAAQNSEDLAPDAALGAAVSKINEILAALRSAGVFLNEEE